MPDPTTLTTAAKINSLARITQDATLQGYIMAWVDAWIQSYCGRTFIPATATEEKYDGDDTDTLILKQSPIVSITTIKVSGQTLDSTVYHDPTNYQSGIYYNQGIVKLLGGVFSCGKQNVYVTYKYGYETIPSALELVATQMCCELYNSTPGAPGIVQSERMGQYSVTYADLEAGKLPYKYAFILDGYRRKF